jgi:fucokinase
MNDEATKLFLAQSHAESLLVLRDAIYSKRAVFWDSILVTAATQAQADIYSHMIRDRIDGGHIPSGCRYIVQPDREEARIGSGGATLCALARLYNDNDGDIDKLISQRCLILHSGGSAKRLPHSAPWGKLFTLSGSYIGDDIRNPSATVFDDLMVTMAGIPGRMTGGIFIVAADAFFRFSHTQFDLATRDAVVFSTKAPVRVGTEHGTYYEKDGLVFEFLHKCSEEELRRKNAVSESGEVDLDIGISFLGENAIKALLGLVTDSTGKIDENALSGYANAAVNLSFYGDIIYPMAGNSTVEDFLEQAGDGPVTRELQELRPAIFEALQHVPLHIFRLVPGTICKIGTTEEALESIIFFQNEAQYKGNKHHDLRTVLNSRISQQADIGANCYIEDSRITDNVRIGDGCLISGCDLPDGFELPRATALHCVPLKDGRWVCRVWGVYDDVKAFGTWLGNPLDQWDSHADSLWNAKLFPVCDEREETIQWAKRFITGGMPDKYIQLWRKCERLALADIDEIDIMRLLSSREIREDSFRAEEFADSVLSGSPVAKSIGYLGLGDEALKRISIIRSLLEKNKYSRWQDVMRLYICLGEAVELLGLDMDSDELREKGFAALRKASVELCPEDYNGLVRWMADTAEVYQPVRINLGGSWSDAPPYCFENGGTMLNAAVSIDGKLPIHVYAERLAEPFVEFVSIDLMSEKRYHELAPLLSYQDPTDPFILFKAALSAASIITAGAGSLKKQLEALGGGIRITCKVDIPKGSGLGTSSILVGAIINALLKLSGRSRSFAELTNDVLIAEQLMTTGGGWQDAIGGMYPGIKITFTEPGIPQHYDVNPVVLSESAEDELNRRGFLLFTGQRRIAKSALVRVLSNYICNHPESLTAFEKIQQLAYTMTYELRRGNISNFGRLLTEHMELLRELDGSSSNLMLEHIINGLGAFTDGSTLCGAGGGGFLYSILKSEMSLDDVRQWIKKDFDGTAIKVFTCEIAQ